MTVRLLALLFYIGALLYIAVPLVRAVSELLITSRSAIL